MGNDIFGVSEKALELCEDRSVLLSDNIVNSATPNYKARDIDFHNILQNQNNQSASLVATDKRHLQATDANGIGNVLYRVPMQSNLDGNTVDEEIERKNFLQNAMNYQVNLTFVKNKSDQLLKAIKGE